MGAPERPQGKSESGQQSVGDRKAESPGIDPDMRTDRQDLRQEGSGKERRHRPEQQTNGDAGRGNDQDLNEIDLKHEAAGRAKTLERGNHRTFGLKKRPNCIRHTDTADNQGRKSDQGQEFGETLDLHLKPGRRIGARANAPAGLRMFLLCGLDRGFDIGQIGNALIG